MFFPLLHSSLKDLLGIQYEPNLNFLFTMSEESSLQSPGGPWHKMLYSPSFRFDPRVPARSACSLLVIPLRPTRQVPQPQILISPCGSWSHIACTGLHGPVRPDVVYLETGGHLPFWSKFEVALGFHEGEVCVVLRSWKQKIEMSRCNLLSCR